MNTAVVIDLVDRLAEELGINDLEEKDLFPEFLPSPKADRVDKVLEEYPSELRRRPWYQVLACIIAGDQYVPHPWSTE